jgi:hypothetical protein
VTAAIQPAAVPGLPPASATDVPGNFASHSAIFVIKSQTGSGTLTSERHSLLSMSVGVVPLMVERVNAARESMPRVDATMSRGDGEELRLSVIESIASNIVHIGTGLRKASQETSAADEIAKRIAVRAAGAGFPGIAGNMSHVRQAVTDIHEGLAAAVASLASTSAVAAAVPSQPGPQETLTALVVLEQTLSTVHGQIGTVLALIARARQLTITVLDGGRPGVMLAALDDIRRTLMAVTTAVNRTRHEVTAAKAEVLRIGDDSAGGSLGLPVDIEAERQIGPDPLLPVEPGWTRVEAHDAPTHVRQAARHFGPRFDGDQHKTTATYRGRTLSSNDRDPELATDLAYEQLRRPNGKPYPQAPDLLHRHPEMQVAADMRRHQLTEAQVVVDNSMCGTREFDLARSLTCRSLLPDAMPAGSRLTVWATLDAGRTFYRTVITGTGRLIRR